MSVGRRRAFGTEIFQFKGSYRRSTLSLWKAGGPGDQGDAEMEEQRMLAEIRDANLSYLMLAQRLIRQDRVEALYRLGIPEEVAALIDTLSPTQMIRIATSNTLLCRVRFDEQMVWSLLADHGAEVQGSAAARLHASILMAGRHAETA